MDGQWSIKEGSDEQISAWMISSIPNIPARNLTVGESAGFSKPCVTYGISSSRRSTSHREVQDTNTTFGLAHQIMNRTEYVFSRPDLSRAQSKLLNSKMQRGICANNMQRK